MHDDSRWAPLDRYLPREVREELEDRLWRPIEAQATLEVLLHDESFFADPGRHPAMFADHGVVHVRDVATALVSLVRTIDGVLLARRPPDRLDFLTAVGVGAAYLHDVGMVDMTPVGRRIHALYAAHVAFGEEADGLVEHLLRSEAVSTRLDDIDRRAPFPVPHATVIRELLSLSAAHSKTTVPASVLDNRPAMRDLMRRIVFTDLATHRAVSRSPLPDGPLPEPLRGAVDRYSDPSAAFAWLGATDGPQAEMADDVIDAIRALRAADVLRQRGSVLRTSGGYEICFDARTAHAVCTMRTVGGDRAYVITYDDHRGAGEANIRVAFVTPQGHLRVAFHRGSFPAGNVARRAAYSVADAIMDVAADVIPSFEGVPARGLPPPSRRGSDMRIELERPDDDPAFADAVADALVARDPALATRIETVADVEGAAPLERQRFHAATLIGADGPLGDELVRRVGDHGVDTAGLDREAAMTEVRTVVIRAGEALVAAGSPPSFVYIPMHPGLVVLPDGGYAPSPLQPWVPVGTTGVIRRAERNATIVAEQDVEVVMIPAARYVSDWLRPIAPAALRAVARPSSAGQPAQAGRSAVPSRTPNVEPAR